MKIKVAKYISKFFLDNGMTDCFMVTGGGAMHLDDAFGHEKGINIIFNHNEQGSSIAAEAYARYSKKIAPVVVTSGPGGTNAITGVMGGYVDSIPMFIISGQVKYETTIHSCEDLGLRQLGDQEFDIISSVKNMTKYAYMIDNPNDIAYHLEKALYLAMDGRKGPVWLDIPLDIQSAIIETDSLKHFDSEELNEKLIVDKDVVKKAIDKIKNAKAPLILAGTGIRLGNAEKEFIKLVDKLKIPVVTEWNAKDLIEYDNEYNIGMPGTVGERAANFAIQNCDVLLVLGSRMNIRMIGYNKNDFAKNAYKIVVDIDKKELSKPTVNIDEKINMDVKDFIDAALDIHYIENGLHKKFLLYCENLKEKYPIVLDKYYKSKKINPYVFIDKLFNKLDGKDKIICGNGSACVITFQAAKIKKGQRMFTNSGCAAMGYGMPASIGVAIANNTNRIICIDGDGSIMMNLQELATVSYNKLNIKIFIINNKGYHSIRQTQNNLFSPPLVGVDSDSGVGFPDFQKIAEAFGLEYENIKTVDDFDNKIKDILNNNKPTIIEVEVDEKQNFEPKSSSKILEDGSIVSSSIDDMYPFLDKVEYESNKYIIKE